MSIEDYNRLRNVQHVTVSHNYTVTSHRNEELIDRVLNIRSFTCYVAKPMKTSTRQPVQP